MFKITIAAQKDEHNYDAFYLTRNNRGFVVVEEKSRNGKIDKNSRQVLKLDETVNRIKKSIGKRITYFASRYEYDEGNVDYFQKDDNPVRMESFDYDALTGEGVAVLSVGAFLSQPEEGTFMGMDSVGKLVTVNDSVSFTAGLAKSIGLKAAANCTVSAHLIEDKKGPIFTLDFE